MLEENEELFDQLTSFNLEELFVAINGERNGQSFNSPFINILHADYGEEFSARLSVELQTTIEEQIKIKCNISFWKVVNDQKVKFTKNDQRQGQQILFYQLH